jgi:hypothetical protein
MLGVPSITATPGIFYVSRDHALQLAARKYFDGRRIFEVRTGCRSVVVRRLVPVHKESQNFRSPKPKLGSGVTLLLEALDRVDLGQKVYHCELQRFF